MLFEHLMNSKTLEDHFPLSMLGHFSGCLLGGAVGDSLGMPTDHGPARKVGESIHDVLGVEWVEKVIDHPRNEKLEQVRTQTIPNKQSVWPNTCWNIKEA